MKLHFKIIGIAALLSVSSMTTAQVVLKIDTQTVQLDSQISDIVYLPSQRRLEIYTQWDDLRCALNPDGPSATLPMPGPGDFVLALDHLPNDPDGDGEYVIEADGSIEQLIAAIAGDDAELEIVTSSARVNNCNSTGCAVLECMSGGTPVFGGTSFFDGSFETPPPPQVDISVNGFSSSSAVAGSDVANAFVQFTVANESIDDATDLIVDLSNQQLPAGVSAETFSVNVGTLNPTSLQWSLPNLAAGVSAIATLPYTASASTPDGSDICVTASVISANENLVNTGDDIEQACVNTVREIDLTIRVISQPTDPQGNSSVVYSFELENLGPSDASDVEVLFLDDSSATAGITRQGVSVVTPEAFSGSTWQIPNLPVSSPVSGLFEVTYAADISVGSGDSLNLNLNIIGSNETRVDTADDIVLVQTDFVDP